MRQNVNQMVEKLKNLSPKRQAEVEDFIDFLQQRDQDRPLRQVYEQVSEEVFYKVWDNDDDAVYDKL